MPAPQPTPLTSTKRSDQGPPKWPLQGQRRALQLLWPLPSDPREERLGDREPED